MFYFSMDRITDYALYSAVVFTVFAVARAANATPALALCLSVIPVVVAWAFTDPTARGMVQGWIGV